MKEKYIDVNRLKENLITEIYSYSKGDIRKRLFARGLSLAYDIVNRQPTVDAVEVVRCKDCKNWLQRSAEVYRPVGIEGCACGSWIRITQENDYCSRGERKDEVTE